MEYINCCLCGSEDFKVLWRHRKDPFVEFKVAKRMRTVVCKMCGLVYLNPRINKKKAQKIYCKDNYRTLKQTEQKSLTQEYLEWATQTNSEKASWILQNISIKKSNGKKRMLDIGCAAGHLMQAFKKRGWETLGIEPNKVAAEYGKNMFSLKIITDFLEEINLNSKFEYFDLITLSHILEHVYDPYGFILSIKSLLKGNGYIFIEVPNILKPAGHLSDFFHSTHLYTFSPSTLEMLLKKSELSTIVMDDTKYRTSTKQVIRTIAIKGPQIKQNFYNKDKYKKIVWTVRNYRIKCFLTTYWKIALSDLIKILLIRIFGLSYGTKLIKYIKDLKKRC